MSVVLKVKQFIIGERLLNPLLEELEGVPAILTIVLYCLVKVCCALVFS